MATQTRSLDFSKIIENSLTGFIILSKSEIEYANPYIYDLLGYNSDEKLQLLSILHPDYHLICKERLKTIFEEKKPVPPMEHKMLTKKGSTIDVEVFGTPYIINNDVLAQIQIHYNPATKNYRSKYIKTEQQNRIISENITDLIAELSIDGVIKCSSPSITTSLGYFPEELIENNLIDYIHPDDESELITKYKKLIITEDSTVVRHRFRCKDGSYLWVESRAKVFYRGSELRIIINSRDISEQKEAEKLLRQSEKMAVIGELSAGVVHEIKNPLTSIKGFLQLMQAGTIETKDYISILNTEIERIEQIANDLLSFAKPSEQLKCEDIGTVIEEVVLLLDMSASKKSIDLVWEKPHDKINVVADKSQLKQVFINIIKNAIEASTLNDQVKILVSTQRNFVDVTVKDHGCGIPKDKLDKIGESFFTTKEKGTGLGLMITQKIVRNYHGKLFIDSEEGKGTSLTVRLPLNVDTN